MAKPISRSYNESEGQSINIISNGTKITGDVSAEGDIRIDGELKGNIIAKGRLVVGSSGKIEGEISCKNIEVSGEVKGKITATELLTMKSMAKVYGDIMAGKLSVEPGSVFTGTCTMGSQANNANEKIK
jgi:cytoskeletal protein CcmA (bactofilin family)